MAALIEWLKSIDAIAAWGAVLSTILAIREYWKSRLQVKIGFSTASIPDVGNKVMIRNNSNMPIIVTYWEIVFRRFRFLPFSESSCTGPDEYFTDFRIPEHSSKILEFTDQDYFSCSPKALKGRKLYFRMYVSGKRLPFVSFLYA
jgi:hypothetical protein